MPTLKTVTSAMTAAVLVTGIGLAVAQTDTQNQPTDPMAAATAKPTSEQTPADPNAPATDATMAAQAQAQQQQQPAYDPSRTTPPADGTTAPLPQDSTAATPSTAPATNSMNSTNSTATTTPSDSSMNSSTTTSTDTGSSNNSSYPSAPERAPRADRN